MVKSFPHNKPLNSTSGVSYLQLKQAIIEKIHNDKQTSCVFPAPYRVDPHHLRIHIFLLCLHIFFMDLLLQSPFMTSWCFRLLAFCCYSKK